MTPSELKHRSVGAQPHFFTRQTMKFFGDRMSNYRCRSAVVHDRQGNRRNVWEIYRKRPVLHGLRSSTFFDKVTFETVFPMTR